MSYDKETENLDYRKIGGIMSEQSISEVRAILAPYSTEKHVEQMKTFMQHGSVSTWQHALNVAFASYTIAKVLVAIGIEIEIAPLIIGAFLHDFYLYDWHTGRRRKEGIHCFTHPLVARKNADQYFDLNDKVLNIIESHMFPTTLRHPPKSKEAMIVCVADKYCAIREGLQRKKGFTNHGKSI